jgi:hypothetical protein
MADALAYHVEIRRSFHRAWAFNLSEERLRDTIVARWLSGRRIELGGRRWEPRESSLRIIAGPELPAPDLAHGQGWNAAQRSGQEVTRAVLGAASPPPRLMVLAESGGARLLLEASEAPTADFLLEAAEAVRSLAARPAGRSPDRAGRA